MPHLGSQGPQALQRIAQKGCLFASEALQCSNLPDLRASFSGSLLSLKDCAHELSDAVSSYEALGMKIAVISMIHDDYNHDYTLIL